MKRGWLLLPLFLVACAHNDYVATTGDPALMQSALHDCSRLATDAYTRSQDPFAGVSGGIAGGLAAGGSVLIAAILGATAATAEAVAPPRPEPMKPSDIDPMIDKCMAQKGYVGHSYN